MKKIFLLSIFIFNLFANESKKIGLVISTYNRPAYLEKTLECLSKTELTDNIQLHLLIIDDASQDQITKNIIKNFTWRNPHVKLEKIFLSQNLGVAKALEKGFSILKNYKLDFYCNLDSDVISNKMWLIKLIDLQKKISKKQKNKHIIYTAYNSIGHPIKLKCKDFAIKNSLGGLNIFFSNKEFYLVMESLKNPVCWDWVLVDLINKNKGLLISTTPSYLQHIGKNGLHSKEGLIIGSNNKLQDIATDFEEDFNP